jgi:hypothetical protein
MSHFGYLGPRSQYPALVSTCSLIGMLPIGRFPLPECYREDYGICRQISEQALEYGQ